MSISEKLTTVSENVHRVYMAGENVGNREGYIYGYNAGYEAGKNEGGGADLPVLDVPAEPSDIRLGKEVINADGEKVTGTMPEHLDVNVELTVDKPNFEVQEGYYNGGYISVSSEKPVSVTPKAHEAVTVRSEEDKFLVEVNVEPATEAYNEGYEYGHRECASKHFAQIVKGTGTTELSFYIPFKPDVVCVTCNDPDLRLVKDNLAIVQVDLSAIGYLSGLCTATSGPSSSTNLGYYESGLLATLTVNNKVSYDADGKLTLKNFAISNVNKIFKKDSDYIIQASKVITKTDKDRISETISKLPDGGTYTIQISKAKKEASFTEDEWKALISTKSTYKFSLF